jgi:uncharacterized protein YacL (UPF0231 family)
MIHQHTIAAAISAIILSMVACDRIPSERIAELEQKAERESERRIELERELEAIRIAEERDAIERERNELIAFRQAIELETVEQAEARARELAEREAALAEREAQANLEADELAARQAELTAREDQLSEEEFARAGQQSVAPANVSFDRVRAPVADYGVFHDSLSSYGSWFDTQDYGYVWQPAVVHQSGWRPYTRGHWVCTDYGWTWVSEEPFGWATYHYGRWALLRGYGWIWVPGYEWAPAWVTWRESGSHIGWAPLPPETLAYSRHRWGSSVEVSFGIGPLWFSFIEYRNFGRPVRHHYLPVARNSYFISNTTNITNIYVQNNIIANGGPNYRTARQRAGRDIPFYRLDLDREGRDRNWRNARVSGNRLSVSAPEINADWNDALRPSRVSKRLEGITVERDRDLDPEITNRFRNERQSRVTRAENRVREWGDGSRFQERRLETLQQNRSSLEVEPVQRDQAERQRREPADPQRREQTDRAQRERNERQAREQAESAEREQTQRRGRDQAEQIRERVERLQRESTDRSQREQNERQRREPTERRQPEVTERQGREQTERAQREQVERQRRDQAEPVQREQDERQRREQAEQAEQVRVRTERQRREQAQRAQQEKVERQRREQAQRAQQEQAERQRREQAERAQREQVERQRREQAQRAQQEQAERAQQEQAERAQREKAERAQREQVERRRRE